MKGILNEICFFKSHEHNMKVLLLTNMIYGFVLPVVEIFAGAYVMRDTNDPAMVAYYQLAMYVGVVFTSMVNGFFLKFLNVKTLYSAGILVSGVSLAGMMNIQGLGLVGLGLAGFSLGAASGFFWTNRYLLALYNTNDENRNYYFGLESFFFSVASITVPLIIGAFIGGMSGVEILGFLFDVSMSYKVVTIGVFFLTLLACAVLWKGQFVMPKEIKFLHIHFHVLWRKMLLLASLKGMVQGFLVTAPAILVMKFVGDEGALGLIQGISGAITAIMVYVLGRIARPQDRKWIFFGSVWVFFIGTLANGILFSAVGVIMFVLCKVIFQPLFDLAYFPVMMRTIDVVAKLESRNEYPYIMSHEVGLFIGRASGLLLFIALAYCISEDFALKYALVIVSALQILAYPLSNNITKQSNLLAKQNGYEEK